jgi:hypothetical protein
VTLIGDRQSASPGASSDFDDMSQRSGPILINNIQKQMPTIGLPLGQQHSAMNGDLMHNINNNHNNGIAINNNTEGSDNSGGGSSNQSGTTTTTRDTEKQLDGVSSELGGSRQSFRMAMGNPCEFFVDVM